MVFHTTPPAGFSSEKMYPAPAMKTALLSCILLLVFPVLRAQADFTPSVKQGCVPLTVNFTDKSSGAVQWLWDFGNGNTSTLQNPSAIYYASGVFSISLTVWDGSGNTSTIKKTNLLRVFKNPKALFTASPNPVCPGETVQFSSSTCQPGDTAIVKYSWDFGNGNLSNKANPGYSYTTPGTYNISLVVTDGHGCQDKLLKNSYIRVKPGPKAIFTVDSGYNCTVPTTFWFNNKSTGGQLSYSWKFGDGNTSTQKSPKHTYNNSGTYSPTLTVTDTNGCSATTTVSGAIVLGPITADFTGSPLRFCGSGKVQFNLTGGSQPSVKYEWDFGDGTTETKASPSHFYNSPGTYTVTLKASSIYRNCSTTVTKNKYVQVDPLPAGSISINDSFPCKPPYSVTLKYNDFLPIQTVNWEYYMDKSYFYAGSGMVLNQTITDLNTRKYRAIVTTKLGCTDTIYLNWPVKGEILKAKFTGDTLGCKPLLSHFIDLSVSNYPIKTWNWVFHDGGLAFSPETDYLYPDTGNFPVKLIVTTTKNCVDSAFHTVHVGQKTDPTFYLGKLQYICNNSDQVFFYNSTKNPGFEIDSFRWVYDDSGKNTLKIPLSQKSYRSTNVSHRYDRDTGMITPLLISYHNGCPDTMAKPDSLFMKPPFARIEKRYDPCISDSLLVFHNSVGADSISWIIVITDMFHEQVYDTFHRHSDSFRIPGYNYYNLILKTFNKTSGCADTAMQMYDPPGSLTFCSPKLSSSCTPSTLEMCVNEVPTAPKYYWTLNGTDTLFEKTKVLYKLDTAGKYKLVFTQDFGKGCIKQNFWEVKVTDGTLHGKVTQQPGCLPVTITLTDSAWVAGPVQHAWHLGNGTIIPVTARDMSYVINSEFGDSFVIRLKNHPDVGNCRPSQTFKLPIPGPGVTLKWAWNSLSCTDLRFAGNAFLNPDKGVKPFSIQWEMGDGKTYNTQFVTHKYADTGWYELTLTVTDAAGCKSAIRDSVYVPENRLNVKIASDTSGSACPPLYVNFRDLSSSGNVPIKSWEWDFGDGSKSTLKNPQHQYVVPGRFPVTLKVTDEQGCTRTVKFPDFITVHGPYGKFSFDNIEGCYPVKIRFTDSVNSGTNTAEWDFGDGVVSKGFDPEHTYKKPGRYIPSLVLSDTLGCKYPVPPYDTIYVYDYPVASFSHDGLCLRDSVQLTSTSKTRDVPLKEWIWISSGSSDIPSDSVSRVKFKFRNNLVSLIVTTEKGCRDTASGPVNLKQPGIELSGTDDTICLGAEWKGSAVVKSDTTLLYKKWLLNGAFYDTIDNISFTSRKSGLFSFSMYALDAAGCWDSIPMAGPLAVGDTVQPPVLTILRTSVDNDVTHHLKFRMHPDFDFKKYTVFRESNGNWIPVKTLNRREDTLVYLEGVNALKYSYCYVASSTNLCGFTNDPIKLLPHCTVEVSGKPDINASVLKWNAYSGWPVLRYDVFREDHTQAGKFDSIGTVGGQTLTYTDTSIVCYVNHVYRIRAIEDQGNREWSLSDTCHVRPLYVNKVPEPGVRRATVVDDRYVRVEWDELRRNRQPLDFFTVEKINGNKWVWLFNSPVADSFRLLDYKTKVDESSYSYRIRSVDICGDSSGYSNLGKSILLKTGINEKYRPVLYWTAYQEWPEGVKEYVIEKRNASGAFEEIGRTATGSDTGYLDAESSLNCVPVFEYRVYAVRNPGPNTIFGGLRSYSNVSGPSVETKIFVPNAFTPDQNSLNEVFRPDGIFIAQYTMSIYNRWGEKVYEGNECMNAWNGRFMGEPAPEGVYIYMISARGIDGNMYRMKGDVTLLR